MANSMFNNQVKHIHGNVGSMTRNILLRSGNVTFAVTASLPMFFKARIVRKDSIADLRFNRDKIVPPVHHDPVNCTTFSVEMAHEADMRETASFCLTSSCPVLVSIYITWSLKVAYIPKF